MRNVRLDELQAGIKIGGRNSNNFRYADDTTLMAESKAELKSSDCLGLLMENFSLGFIIQGPWVWYVFSLRMTSTCHLETAPGGDRNEMVPQSFPASGSWRSFLYPPPLPPSRSLSKPPLSASPTRLWQQTPPRHCSHLTQHTYTGGRDRNYFPHLQMRKQLQRGEGIEQGDRQAFGRMV